MLHRFYIYSNLNGCVPKVKLHCPASLILAGNFGCINDDKTWQKMNTFKEQGFTNIFWVPYLLEFSAAKHPSDLLKIGVEFNKRCQDHNIIQLNNQIVTFMGIKIIGSPMFPASYNYYFAAEDTEFVCSEATTDSLVVAGSICPTAKAKYVVHGTPPTGLNFAISNDRQMHITNSRDAIGFSQDFYVDINCSSWQRRDLE
jgi:hypothetical protein